jgi:hypothetical protein
LSYLVLKTSPQRRAFKAAVGQGNHFLITVLVGLKAVEDKLAVPGETFSTSWAPKDPAASARRSRSFVHRAALSLLIDSLDAYITDVSGQPAVIQDQGRLNRLAKASSRPAVHEAVSPNTRDVQQSPSSGRHLPR